MVVRETNGNVHECVIERSKSAALLINLPRIDGLSIVSALCWKDLATCNRLYRCSENLFEYSSWNDRRRRNETFPCHEQVLPLAFRSSIHVLLVDDSIGWFRQILQSIGFCYDSEFASLQVEMHCTGCVWKSRVVYDSNSESAASSGDTVLPRHVHLGAKQQWNLLKFVAGYCLHQSAWRMFSFECVW